MSQLCHEIYKENKLNNMSVLLNGTDGKSTYGYGYGYGKMTEKKNKNLLFFLNHNKH